MKRKSSFSSMLNLRISLLLMLLCLLFPPLNTEGKEAEDPRVKTSVDRGLASLRLYQFQFQPVTGLVVYTLLVGGDSIESPTVSKGLDIILSKFEPTNLTYRPKQHHYYEAAIDIMALEKADSVKYRPHIQEVANYIMQGQLNHGGWYYPGPTDNLGDTSITQYALLGLWAAHRAGIKIPTETWEKAAQWHLKTQTPSGGYSYHPRPNNLSQLESTGTMSAAGSGSLGIIRLVLFGDRALPRDAQEGRLKFGVLERDSSTGSNSARPTHLKRGDFDRSLERTHNWLAEFFERNAAAEHNGFLYYYYYTLERAAVVNRWARIGTHDWYQRGIEVLLPRQNTLGEWPESGGQTAHRPSGTCFTLLFLMRATQKILPTGSPPPTLGEGLLAGGRGLPEDLTQVEFRNGRVQTESSQDNLDKLLAGMTSIELTPATPNAKPEIKVDLTDPEKLVGNTSLLAQLVKHQDPRVRQLAAWALGRTDQLEQAPLLLTLLKDSDLEVAIEARYALCWIARRPNGFQPLTDPRLTASGNTPVEDVSSDKIQQWQSQIHQLWQTWYLQQRPYDLRDDFQDPDQKKFQRKK